MKMMQRSMTVANPERIGRSNGGGDIIFGVLHRGPEVEPRGESSSNRRRQSTAAAMCVPGRDAHVGQTSNARRIHQQINSLGPIAVAAFDQNRLRAKAQYCTRLLLHLTFRTCRRTPQQRGSFRQIGRDDQCARYEQGPHRLYGVRSQQTVARCRNHHRIKNDVSWAVAVKALCHRFDGLSPRQHSDLHRVDVKVGKNSVDLRSNKIGWYIVNRGNALRILCRQRRNNRRAIDSESAERLQVGLNAGAAAGIRTSECYGNGGHGRPRCLSALSTTARSSPAAPCGSGASDKAEITATPSAPAAITLAAFPALIPAIAQIG